MEGDTPCARVGMRAFADQAGDWIMVHVGGMLEIADQPGFPASASADERALVRAFAGIVRQYHALQAGQATIGRAALLARVTPDERRIIEAAARCPEPPRRSRPRRGTLQRAQEDLADLKRRAGMESTPCDDPPPG